MSRIRNTLQISWVAIFVCIFVTALSAHSQNPSSQSQATQSAPAQTTPAIPKIDGGVGACSADFTVRDGDRRVAHALHSVNNFPPLNVPGRIVQHSFSPEGTPENSGCHILCWWCKECGLNLKNIGGWPTLRIQAESSGEMIPSG